MVRLSRNSSKLESAGEDFGPEVKREVSVDDEMPEEPSNARVAAIKQEEAASGSESPSMPATKIKSSRSSSTSSSSSKRPSAADLSAKNEPRDANGLNSTSTSPVKPEPKEPSKPARSSRTASKLPPRIAPILSHLPDATTEASSTFTVVDACTYQNKYLGFSEHALDCDCVEEWGESAMPTCSENGAD
jgi:histone-lysine N-methyltransferase SETD2